MEDAIKTIVTTFLKSSKGRENLNPKCFQKLVKDQLCDIMEDTNNSKKVKEMQAGLDADKDGKVSFEEYLKLIGHLANRFSECKTGNTQVASDAS